MTTPAPPPPSAGARPPLVTSAGIVLIVVGALNILGGIAILGLGVGAIGTLVGGIALVLGAAALYAGIQVLGLKEQGRVIGLAVAGISALLNIYSITQGVTTAIINLGLNAFLIYALVTTQTSFRRA